MRFRGWTIAGPSEVKMKEFDTEVGGGLIATDDPEFESAPRTPLKDDQVIIRNRVAGICGSDKWVYVDGGDIRRPRGCQFGHEMVSEVIAKGKGVEDLEIGERVYPFPLLVKETTRYAGRPGGYSELIVVDHAKKNYNLYPLSDDISDKAAAMIEPFSIGFKAAVITNAQSGKKAVVIGAGPIGLSAAICLRELGVEDILVLGRSPERLELARGLDQKQPFDTFSTSHKDWFEDMYRRYGEIMTQLGRAIDVDVWIDAAADKDILELIYNNGKNFAAITVVGAHPDDICFDLRRLTWGNISLLGSGGYRPVDVPRVINAMENKRYDIDSMVTATYPFEKFDEAIEFAKNDSTAVRVQIDYNL